MSENAAVRPWIRLDNAATIYPHARTRNWNNVYRLAFVMREDVDPAVLKRAVDELIPRFPSLFVTLRAGVFWYYFESCPNSNVLVKEKRYPCSVLDVLNSKKPAFRIVFGKRRIAYEGFHSLTDGTGGFGFLKALVVRYLSLKGVDVGDVGDIKSPDDTPAPGELEDSFKKHYSGDLGKVKRSLGGAYKYKPEKRERGIIRVIHGIIPVDDLKAATKERGITVTDYLLAMYLYALYKDCRERFGSAEMKKPITISVPINLRQLFESESMRNFSLYANIGFLPESGRDYTFEDIAGEIAGRLKQALSKENMHRAFSKNVSDASNPVMRAVPLPLKRIGLRTAYNVAGERLVTSNMTNIGIVKLPDAVAAHVERVECLLCLTPHVNINCSIVSYNGNLNIAFTAASRSVGVQREFFRALSEHGIRVRIESNM